jgi:hypothetical protein
LHIWTQKISAYAPTITRLEERLGDHAPALRVILLGDAPRDSDIIDILNVLSASNDWPQEVLMQDIVGRLKPGGEHALGINLSVTALMGIEEEGIEACQRIWEMEGNKDVPRAAIEVSESAGFSV